MSGFVPWDSQPLEEWSQEYARGQFIELDNLSMHYVEKGTGDPIILIHGFFFDSNMWNWSIDALAEHYKVFAIDLWGFGYSSREPLAYGYQLYADQLSGFMDRLGIQKASLIGQSMGGGTIIKYAIANQSRVDKIILVDAAGMPNKLPIMGRISNLPALGELLYSINNNFMRRFTLGSTFVYNKDILSDGFYEQLTRFHKIEKTSEVMLKITRNQFFDTLTDEINILAGMEVPILIVWGKEEKSIRLPIGIELARKLKGSKLEILEQAGHCSNIDQPGQFNRLVLDFLAPDDHMR